MGGCCCSSRKAQLHGTPIYYYSLRPSNGLNFFPIILLHSSPSAYGKPHQHLFSCPPALEEHDSLTSHDSAAVSRATGFLVDLNLDASSPDTYRCPPTPIPFDVVLGYPQSTDSEFAEEIIIGSSFEKASYVNRKELDCKAQAGAVLASPRKSGVELLKLNEANVSTTEEEDICPTCLEDYDAENPKIITKCNHHFHLSCILEWMERSDMCPICNKEMDFEAL